MNDTHPMSRIYYLEWAEESVNDIKDNDVDFGTKGLKVQRGHKVVFTSFT